ncbi:MAG: redoxin domain-containing protein, partial [Candidatus Obscuribacterales bacterium]|nr:redoxin domain-containing protein [Steroidobacteraceae bacterium]
MKKLINVLTVVSIAAAANFSMAATRVGDFSLLDQKGYFHQMSYYDNHKAIALLVQSNGSKATEKAVADFKSTQAKYKDQVKFFMINPSGTQQRDAVQKQIDQYGADIPVLMDDAQVVSESLGVKKTGEVFLLDPKSLTVIYRGRVEKHLDKAIDDVLAGHSVKKAKARVKGEKLAFEARQAHAKTKVSYSKDVAPILAENCARCHRENGIAPFAMNSYAAIKGWAPMIREVVRTKRMPPGQVDPHIGNFKETYTLTPAETQKLVHWVEAGAQKDDGADPLAALRWPATKWALGEPDLVVKVPPQKVPATGVLDYIRVDVPIEGLDRDRWVRASQYLAGDRTVLHHTLNNLIPPDAKKDARGAFLGGGDPNQARITAYIPGAQPQIEPPNTGGLLKKGSTLALQLHYTTNGKATTDASEIGLWFYPEGQVPAERMAGDCACIFTRGWQTIPPHNGDFEMTQTITVPKEAFI